MKYILKTTYPCLIKTENEFCELDNLETIEVEDEKFLFVYPQNHEQTPFKIDFSKESEFYSILHRENQTFVILEKPSPLSITQKEKLTISGKTCQISIDEKKLEFETDTHKFSFPHKREKFKAQKIKNFACAIFEHEIYALNMQTNKLVYFSGDEISLKDNEIVLTKKFCDSLQRQKEAKYKLDNEVQVESENFLYSNYKDVADLVPFRLLESVKAKDYAFAMDCLSQNLKDSVDSEMLKKFFGNLKHFLPLCSNQFITIADNKKNFVTFSLSGDKIDDISIDEL
ncbi:MAG: hypothetical protein ACI4R8_04525 [Candidatus Caccovivens sp.]